MKDPQQKANKRWRESSPEKREHSNYLKARSGARSFIRNRAELSDLKELKELIKKREAELKMNYEKELEWLEKENGSRSRLHVYTYKNKEELLEALSVNADEPKETYEYMKEELEYLSDEGKVYQVDKGNGLPEYFDDAKEAYESI